MPFRREAGAAEVHRARGWALGAEVWSWLSLHLREDSAVPFSLLNLSCPCCDWRLAGTSPTPALGSWAPVLDCVVARGVEARWL